MPAPPSSVDLHIFQYQIQLSLKRSQDIILNDEKYTLQLNYTTIKVFARHALLKGRQFETAPD